MSETHSKTDNSGALVMYMIAALIVAGAVAGVLAMGLGGMILWFVAITFICLALMVVVSIG